MKKSCNWYCRKLTDHQRITRLSNSLKHWGGRRELNPRSAMRGRRTCGKHMKKSCNWYCRKLTDHKRITRLSNSLKHWGGRRELNPQPSEPQSDALPIELLPP